MSSMIYAVIYIIIYPAGLRGSPANVFFFFPLLCLFTYIIHLGMSATDALWDLGCTNQDENKLKDVTECEE